MLRRMRGSASSLALVHAHAASGSETVTATLEKAGLSSGQSHSTVSLRAWTGRPSGPRTLSSNHHCPHSLHLMVWW